MPGYRQTGRPQVTDFGGFLKVMAPAAAAMILTVALLVAAVSPQASIGAARPNVAIAQTGA